MIVIKKDLNDKVVIDYKTDLINYLYIILLKVCKIDSWSKKTRRKTWVINVYDNQIRRRCIWDGSINHTIRALEDINWELVIQDRVLIASDINAYSLL